MKTILHVTRRTVDEDADIDLALKTFGDLSSDDTITRASLEVRDQYGRVWSLNYMRPVRRQLDVDGVTSVDADVDPLEEELDAW